MGRVNSRMDGFSLLECCVVIGVVGVLVAITLLNASSVTQNSKAESAVSLVLSQMRLARSLAVTQRRNVVVAVDTNFSGPENAQHLNLQVVPLPGEPPQPLQSFPLLSGAQFVLEPGVPDTPEKFGNSMAVCFGDGCSGSSVMQFTPSGSFVDGRYQPLNGTIFLGIPGIPGTARAVTVIGGAGDIQWFTWTGTQWVR